MMKRRWAGRATGRGVLSIAVVVSACAGEGGRENSFTTGPTGPAVGSVASSSFRGTSALACAAGPVVTGEPDLVATLVAEGFAGTVDAQFAAGDASRMFVVEQQGMIHIVSHGERVAERFLDIRDRVREAGEAGLVGLAFHPNYAKNGRFFVYYVDKDGVTTVSEFLVSGDPDVADAESERVLLKQTNHYGTHYGGRLTFAPDGKLYIGVGDGGSTADEENNGQNLGTFLGKILRIDVDHGLDEDHAYSVPSDNPFLNEEGVAPEVWALGLRNPWRFSFDTKTNELYVGDVGEHRYEEVNIAQNGGRGANFGWNITEGPVCTGGDETGCDIEGITMPSYSYGHDEGKSVIGGFVYHGCRMPGYDGTYFFGDFISPFVRSFRPSLGAASLRDWSDAMPGVTLPASFSVDPNGEILIVDYDGEIWRIEPASTAAATGATLKTRATSSPRTATSRAKTFAR